KNPARIPRVIIYLMIQMARLLFYKAGLLPYARVVRAGSRELARLLKGISKSEASSLFYEAARKTVDTAREETLNLLKKHQEEGHTVILVSGSFQPFLVEVASLLGIKTTL
ncbi:unnamed protein product, partial [marine sediment metagenome]